MYYEVFTKQYAPQIILERTSYMHLGAHPVIDLSRQNREVQACASWTDVCL